MKVRAGSGGITDRMAELIPPHAAPLPEESWPTWALVRYRTLLKGLVEAGVPMPKFFDVPTFIDALGISAPTFWRHVEMGLIAMFEGPRGRKKVVPFSEFVLYAAARAQAHDEEKVGLQRMTAEVFNDVMTRRPDETVDEYVERFMKPIKESVGFGIMDERFVCEYGAYFKFVTENPPANDETRQQYRAIRRKIFKDARKRLQERRAIN